MEKYNEKNWGIPEKEYARLMDAVSQGIVPELYINSVTIYRLKIGDVSVDDLINSMDRKKSFVSDNNPNRDCIDQNSFERIVSSILDSTNEVFDYTFSDKCVDIVFYSNSRKQKWTSRLNFNDNGRITGRFTYSQPYYEAAKPRYYGAIIRNKIKSSFYSDDFS